METSKRENTQNDQDLISRIARGDQQAVRELHTRFGKFACGVAGSVAAFLLPTP